MSKRSTGKDSSSKLDLSLPSTSECKLEKPKRRSLIERELETNLTERVTSPVNAGRSTNTSRYGRTRKVKDDADFCDTDKAVKKLLKSPKCEVRADKSPVKSPVYKMYASNSPIRKEVTASNISNQIDSIINENTSLSRFASEVKSSSTAKIPKVYIHKDLIQRKEDDETAGLLKNMFSPTKSHKPSTNSHLNNILERSSEKYALKTEVPKENGFKETPSVVKILDFDEKKKSIKTENQVSEEKKKVEDKGLVKSKAFDVEANCPYQVGDLAWSRVGTYPFWPCIVTKEPFSGIFAKRKLFGRVEHYIVHVTFFGDNGRRGWIVDNMLRPFSGKKEFEDTRDNFTAEAKKKDRGFYSAFFVSDKKRDIWSTSVDEAEILMREPKRLRIDALNEMLGKTTKPPKSKVSRTDSDVSLSESLYDSLFSEDDSKMDNAERTRKRTRNKSFDVSEVVTACLDNMAAIAGIPKIQKQSHMDRWLQKAKSKTPEKPNLKESKGSKKKSEIRSSKKYPLRKSGTEKDFTKVDLENENPQNNVNVVNNGIGAQIVAKDNENLERPNQETATTDVNDVEMNGIEVNLKTAGNDANDAEVNGLEANHDDVNYSSDTKDTNNRIDDLESHTEEYDDLSQTYTQDEFNINVEIKVETVDENVITAEAISNKLDNSSNIDESMDVSEDVSDNISMQTSPEFQLNQEELSQAEDGVLNSEIMEQDETDVGSEEIKDINNTSEEIVTEEAKEEESTPNYKSIEINKPNHGINVPNNNITFAAVETSLDEDKANPAFREVLSKDLNITETKNVDNNYEDEINQSDDQPLHYDTSENSVNCDFGRDTPVEKKEDVADTSSIESEVTNNDVEMNGVFTETSDNNINNEENTSDLDSSFELVNFSDLEETRKEELIEKSFEEVMEALESEIKESGNALLEDISKEVNQEKNTDNSIERVEKTHEDVKKTQETVEKLNNEVQDNKNMVVGTEIDNPGIEENCAIEEELVILGSKYDKDSTVQQDSADDTSKSYGNNSVPEVSSENPSKNNLEPMTQDKSIEKLHEDDLNGLIDAQLSNTSDKITTNGSSVINKNVDETQMDGSFEVNTDKGKENNLQNDVPENVVIKQEFDPDNVTENENDNSSPDDNLNPEVESHRSQDDKNDDVTVKMEVDETETEKQSVKKVKRAKTPQSSAYKALDDPEFIKYLELHQDALLDENPDLSQDDLVNYLYKTWQYDQNLKSDKGHVEEDHTLLVKGLDNEVQPKRVVRKKEKIKVEKEFSIKVEPDVHPIKDKPKRKSAKTVYVEDESDESELEVFPIFKINKPVKVSISDVKADPDLNVDEVTDVDDVYDEVEEYFANLTKPKPNIFKGLIRERVCDICHFTGKLVKCKGPCHGTFHVDCVKKEAEIALTPTASRGRKKKKIRGRKPKGYDDESHSDDKSHDLSEDFDEEVRPNIVFDPDTFEAEFSTKLQSILNVDEVIEIYSSDEDEVKHNTVAGKCEIVDVKLKIKSEIESYDDFKCNSCQKSDTPLCFVCKSASSPKSDKLVRQKCQVAHCHTYYHIECLDSWPQTHIHDGEPSKNKKTAEYIESVICPRHVCHTCVSDDPRGCKTRFSGDKLAKCVKCPATYHSFTKCLPAGTVILTASYIICPRHCENGPGKVPCHVNTGWCFICAKGGSLICCEYCPTSFHAECLNIKPPEGNYMCEDCETGRLPLYGEMVWVKLGHYRWWPGIILHPIEIPHNISIAKHSQGEFVVRFFGQYDHYWVNRGRVFPFQEGDSGRISSQKSKIDEAFTLAMEHAQRAFEILKDAPQNDSEDAEIQSSLLPPHYVKLRVNKPCGSLVSWRNDDDANSLTQCDCDPQCDQPCGENSDCLNRMLLTECGPQCRAGDRCCNRAFEKRQYPKMCAYKTPHRGWGLKTLEGIRAGQFVIEYVGELIDETEFQRRMRRKHETRDQNFYFLTLDKDRMIDAGPKGNLARFMNHSCDPNCETQKWTVLGDVRVGLFAINDIPANSELTFNYNLECAGIEKKRCMCGSKRCSGYMGAKPKQIVEEKKPKRVYKKRKQPSPTTPKIKPKPRTTTRSKPRELTEIEKDLLIIKNATNGMSSDSEVSLDGNVRCVKRKKVSFSIEDDDGDVKHVAKKFKVDDCSVVLNGIV